MSRVAWDAHDRLDALLDYLAVKEGNTDYADLRAAVGRQEIRAEQAEYERQRAVDDVVADYEAAVVDYDAAVAEYGNAANDSERITALVNGLLATRAQQEAIVSYLLIGGL